MEKMNKCINENQPAQKPENKWKVNRLNKMIRKHAMKTHYDCDKQKPDQTNEVNLWEKHNSQTNRHVQGHRWI